MPLAYVAWRAGTTYRVVVPVRQAGNRFLGSLKGLQIRALAGWYDNPIPTRFLGPTDFLKNSSILTTISGFKGDRGKKLRSPRASKMYKCGLTFLYKKNYELLEIFFVAELTICVPPTSEWAV